MQTISNCQIQSTMLGREDHGCFTFVLQLGGDGWGQGYGTFTLDTYNKNTKRREGTAFGLECLMRVLDTLEVYQWEKLKGVYCRIKRDGEFGPIEAIGHIYKEKWFSCKELADEMGLSRNT